MLPAPSAQEALKALSFVDSDDKNLKELERNLQSNQVLALPSSVAPPSYLWEVQES